MLVRLRKIIVKWKIVGNLNSEKKILIRISAMSLLGLGLLGYAAQKRSEYISGIED